MPLTARQMRTSVLAVAALVLLSALVAGGSTARAAGWTAPTPLKPSNPSTAGTANTRMAVNAKGDQVLIWDDMQDMGTDDPTCFHSEVTTRVAGGTWAPTVVVPCGAKLAIGSGGGALVFWADSATGHAKVATAQAGSSFGSPVTADSSTADHRGLTGAVDSQGIPTIAWATGAAYGSSSVHAKTANTDGTWSPAVAAETVAGTATGRSYNAPSLAIGPQGDAVIGVTSSTYIPANTPTTTYLFQAYSRPASPRTWTGVNLIGPAPQTQLDAPVVAFDPQGRATIAISSGWTTFSVLAWSRPAGSSSSWSSTQTVETGSRNVPLIGMGIDGAGTVQLGYSYSDATYTIYVHAASRGAGSTAWSTPADLVSAGCGTTYPSDPPSVAIDSSNRALIGFSCAGAEYTFQRLAGSTNYTEFTRPAGGSAVDYTTDANGYVIATWAAGGVIYTSVYDPVAPSVDSFGTTAAPVAGQPVSFDVAGSDVWGPVTYRVDFGDGSPTVSGRALARSGVSGARAISTGSVAHTYASQGNYTATVTITDGAANSASTVVPVAVAAAPSAAAAPVTPSAPPAGPALPPPTLGRTINVFVLKQPVRVKLPGTRTFRALTKAEQLPNGTVIDARRGRVLVVIADGTGGTDEAEFYEGLFEVNQPKRLKGLANIFLDGGGFKGCPKAPKNPHAQVSAKSKKRSVRHLWAKGAGKFRTVGRFSSATVRGTWWLTDDRCDGTLTKVREGRVGVRDFVLKKNVIVRAGRSYFAKARQRR